MPLLIALLAALPALGYGLGGAWPAAGTLSDPDSYMRLVRLRQMLAAGRPDDVVHADGSGLGTPIPWSHLLDTLLLLLAAPLRLAMDQDRALAWAAALSGPLEAGLLAGALAWAVRPFAGRWWWLAGALGAICPSVLAYGAWGRAHHHVPVALCLALAAGSLARAMAAAPAAQAPRLGTARQATAAGLWCGLGIWLTPEAAPIALLLAATAAAAWLQGAPPRTLRRMAGGLTVLLLAAWLADPPPGGLLAAPIDRLGWPFVLLAALLLAGATLLGALDRMRQAGRLSRPGAGLAACAAAALLAGLWLACVPALLRGPTAPLDAADARLFFGVIGEMQPIRTAPEALVLLAPGAVAAVMAAILALRHRSLPWGSAALGVALLVLAGALHRRFDIYGQLAGAACLPLALQRATDPDRMPSRWQMPAALTALCAVLLPPLAGLLLASPATAAQGTPCALRDVAAALAPEAGLVVLAEPKDAPELLYRTRARTVGSFYHGGIAGFLRDRAAWREPPGPAPGPALLASGARLVLACRGGPRPAFLADLPRTTLFDRLQQGTPPPWLHPVTLPAAADRFLLFRLAP